MLCFQVSEPGKCADFITEGQIVEVKTSEGHRTKLSFYRGSLNIQKS